MKKRSILVFLLAAALTVGNAVPTVAAPYGGGRGGRCGQNYVDANGDGVCDNFVDANGDGINDNCPGYGNGQGCGNGQRRGNGQGCGNGPCVQNKTTTASPVKNNGVKKAVVKKASTKKVVVKKATIKKATIKLMQKRLNKIGYNCGKANGTMNKTTKNALKKFKKASGLKANSSITKATLKALRISQ